MNKVFALLDLQLQSVHLFLTVVFGNRIRALASSHPSQRHWKKHRKIKRNNCLLTVVMLCFKQELRSSFYLSFSKSSTGFKWLNDDQSS